jgi:hypothetical protein
MESFRNMRKPILIVMGIIMAVPVLGAAFNGVRQFLH